MKERQLDRDTVVEAFIRGLEPLDYVDALWQAGSIAFGRHDEWSDIDLYIVCADDRVEDLFADVTRIVDGLGGGDLSYRLPEPTWHGHSQVFTRLKRASPFLFLDIAVMKRSSEDKFLQYRVHGTPVVHLDKTGVVRDHPVKVGEFLERLQRRVETLRATFPLFQILPLKELNRGNDIVGYNFYLGSVIRPLVEALRIVHSPYHYNFHMAYVFHDLPAEIVERLRSLIFVRDGEGIRKAHQEACGWFNEVIASIDWAAVKAKLE